MNPRKWDIHFACTENRSRLRDEHNTTVQAWQDATSELARLSKINDSMCDTIAVLEARIQELGDVPRGTIRWSCSQMDFAMHLFGIDAQSGVGAKCNYDRAGRAMEYLAQHAVSSPIRVPFTESQIEAMAAAAYDSRYGGGLYAWSVDATREAKVKWQDAIRAALAAGGLDPCAVPEYKPEDVALTPTGAVLRDRLVEAERKIENQRMHINTLERREERRKAEALKASTERASDEELAVEAHNTFNGASAQHITSIGQAVFAESWMRVIAPADTLEKLAEIGRSVDPVYWDEWNRLSDKHKQNWRNLVAAILRAAKARVDVDAAALINKRNELTSRIKTDARQDYQEIIDWLNQSITFGVEVPITPVWSGPTRAEAEAKLKEIRSRQNIAWHVLREFERWLLPLLPETAAAGWELDVTESELSAWIDAMDDGEFCLDHFIALIKSRIRPAACKECAKMKEQRKAFRKIVLDGAEEVRNRINAARAALEEG